MDNFVDAIVAVFNEIYVSEFFNNIMTKITDVLATFDFGTMLDKLIAFIMSFIPLG